jgi:hypothetical protein
MRPLPTRLPTAAALLLAVLASACTTVVPVIPKLVSCDIAAAQLQEACAEPGVIGPDVSYSDVIGIAIVDRKNLRQCAEKTRFLAASVTACNTAIAEHNKKLDEINAQLTKKP